MCEYNVLGWWCKLQLLMKGGCLWNNKMVPSMVQIKRNISLSIIHNQGITQQNSNLIKHEFSSSMFALFDRSFRKYRKHGSIQIHWNINEDKRYDKETIIQICKSRLQVDGQSNTTDTIWMIIKNNSIILTSFLNSNLQHRGLFTLFLLLALGNNGLPSMLCTCSFCVNSEWTVSLRQRILKQPLLGYRTRHKSELIITHK